MIFVNFVLLTLKVLHEQNKTLDELIFYEMGRPMSCESKFSSDRIIKVKTQPERI